MEIVIDGDVFTVTEETPERVYYKDDLENVKFVERTDSDWSYATRRALYVFSEGYRSKILAQGINLIEVPPGMTDEQAIKLFDDYADKLGDCSCGLPAKWHLGHPKIIELKPIGQIGVK